MKTAKLKFSEKLNEIAKIRFQERDDLLQTAMQNVFEEMERRGMIVSSASAYKIRDVVACEIVQSTIIILQAAKESHSLYFPRLSEDILKIEAAILLKKRFSEIDSAVVSKLNKMFDKAANAKLLETIRLQKDIGGIESELFIEVDKYFTELNEKTGKTLKDRIITSFNNNPFIVITSIVIAVIILLSAFVVALRNLN